MTMKGFVRGVTAALALTAVAGHCAEPSAAGKDRHMGAASCASAGCHGALRPAPGSNVNQNEFSVWEREDAHANAWRVLASARGQRIAANLNLRDAQQAPECLGCHSNLVAPEQQGRRYRVSEGVSCEACHGAAERWLPLHSTTGRQHQQNLDAGLYPLSDPAARARVCLNCHLGSEARPIDHRLMSAGHPPLVFELDTFTAIQPAHFKVDRDYRERKGSVSGARTWVLGQLTAAGFVLDALAGNRFEQAGLFPELALYDCNACHHKPGRGSTPGDAEPGVARLAAVPLALTAQILNTLLPATAPEWSAELRRLHQASSRDRGQTRESAIRLNRLLKDAQTRLAANEIAVDSALNLLKALADSGQTQAADLSYAEACAMGLGALTNHLVQERGKGGAQLKPALDSLFAAVEKPEAYDPARFRSALGRLRETAVKQFGSRS